MRLVVYVGLCLVASSATAYAQPSARARAAFVEGSVAYEAGHFEEALVLFREAYELSRNAGLQYNIALVAERLQRLEEAATAYERYLEEDIAGSRRANVEARLAVIRQNLADRATHDADVERQREEVIRELEANAEREREEATRSAAAEARATALAENELVEVGPGIGPWVVGAAGIAALLTGAGFLIAGQHQINNVKRAVLDTAWVDVADDYPRGIAFARIGWILAGVGLTAMASGVIWQMTGWKLVPAGQATPITVTLDLGPTSLVVRGTF